MHWSLTSLTQSASIERDFGPDSPPTITQSMPDRFSLPRDPSQGSSERNFVFAGVFLR